MHVVAMLLRIAGRRVTSTRGLNPHVRTRLQSTATGGPTYNPVRVVRRAMLGARLAATAYYGYQGRLEYAAVLQRARHHRPVPDDLIPEPAFRVGYIRAKEMVLYSAVQVLDMLPTPRMILEPYLFELLNTQFRLGILLAPVGEHEVRKAVLLRAGDVHKRVYGDSSSEPFPKYVRGRLALYLASTHVMLGELEEAAAIVDEAVKDVQSRRELSEDQVLDVQVPLLRAQALIKAADGQAVEAMEVQKSILALKVLESSAQPDGSTGNRTPGTSYIAGEIAKALIHGDMARIALTLGPTTELPPLSYGAENWYMLAMYLANTATLGLYRSKAVKLGLLTPVERDGLTEFMEAHKLHEMQPEAQDRFEERCELAESVISIRSMVLAATRLRMPNGGVTEKEVANFVEYARGFPVRLDYDLKDTYPDWAEYLMDFELGRTGYHMQALIMHKALAEHLRAKGDGAQADAEDERALEAFAVVRERRTFYRLREGDSAMSWRTLSDRIEAAIALEHAAFMYPNPRLKNE